ILMKKLRLAAKDTGIRQVALAGGVSANTGLRKALEEHARRYRWKGFIPPISYSTDNAAMIACTGYFKYLDRDFCEIDVPIYSKNSL
ncbi:MAG TPA: tRNA (adenosine(37)-N6)-threonylcarbamoyltransferase complex transferase subunit TsaD, partial [Bacteroidaceae bacterium]|nr:tRNA (adenosine(37)-N6)-threonylcarbamoyltransferase complex transferase subunit TsaD [Bacteroidaceae bacterium]